MMPQTIQMIIQMMYYLDDDLDYLHDDPDYLDADVEDMDDLDDLDDLDDALDDLDYPVYLDGDLDNLVRCCSRLPRC